MSERLEYYAISGSDRHLRDISMMLDISGEKVDSAQLRRWVERLGLDEAWVNAKGYESADDFDRP